MENPMSSFIQIASDHPKFAAVAALLADVKVCECPPEVNALTEDAPTVQPGPAKRTRKSKADAPASAEQTSPVVQAPAAPVASAPVNVAVEAVAGGASPVPTPAVPAAAAPAVVTVIQGAPTKKVTKDEAIAMLGKVFEKHGIDVTTQCLQRVGAAKMGDMKEELYGTFVEVCEKALATGAA